jgi:hypothetical protein
MDCSRSSVGGSVVKPLRHLARQEGRLLVVLGVPASTPWWTFVPLLPPLVPPTVSKRLRGRLLLAPRRGDPVVRAVFLLLQVVIPAMTLQSHSLRLEVAAVQLQFHFLCACSLRVLGSPSAPARGPAVDVF